MFARNVIMTNDGVLVSNHLFVGWNEQIVQDEAEKCFRRECEKCGAWQMMDKGEQEESVFAGSYDNGNGYDVMINEPDLHDTDNGG